MKFNKKALFKINKTNEETFSRSRPARFAPTSNEAPDETLGQAFSIAFFTATSVPKIVYTDPCSLLSSEATEPSNKGIATDENYLIYFCFVGYDEQFLEILSDLGH